MPLAPSLPATPRQVLAVRARRVDIACTGQLSFPNPLPALLFRDPDEPDIEIIEAWGCPECGRIDAPQPCLGVCIRRPALVADASELREFAARCGELAAADRELSELARIVAAVTPRPGRDEQTWAVLRSRARELLDRIPT